MNWTPLGPRALLVEFGGDDSGLIAGRARAVQRFLEASTGDDLVDFSIAFDRVLLEFRPDVEFSPWIAKLASLPPLPPAGARLHEVPVRYDGEDLAELAAWARLSVAEVVALHSGPVYDVALLGFSPGFPYLEGLDARLHAPRRSSPRPRVPAGAVAIGGLHTGIYSVETPGGWHLLGQTGVRLFDPGRVEPDEEAMFLLRPGDRVKFVPIP